MLTRGLGDLDPVGRVFAGSLPSGFLPHLHQDMQGFRCRRHLSGGQGKHFLPLSCITLTRDATAWGYPPPYSPMPSFSVWSWSSSCCCILWTFHIWAGRAPPPPSWYTSLGVSTVPKAQNMGGGFPPCWTYLSLAPSLLVLSFVTLHSWEGPFLHISFGRLPLTPPFLLVISFDAFQGGPFCS